MFNFHVQLKITPGGLVQIPNEVWSAVACALRQTCLVHLLRDLEQVEKYKRPSKHWPAFAKKLRRLIGDAIRLWRA